MLAGYVQALKHNMLLLGRTAGDRKSDPEVLPLLQSEPPQARAVSRLAAVKKAVDAWWEENSRTAFSLLLTRNKWQVQKRNLQVRDIVQRLLPPKQDCQAWSVL